MSILKLHTIFMGKKFENSIVRHICIFQITYSKKNKDCIYKDNSNENRGKKNTKVPLIEGLIFRLWYLQVNALRLVRYFLVILLQWVLFGVLLFE